MSNLGATSLRRRARPGNPMRAFDALPEPLRRWIAQARMPWSPASCLRIWHKARAKGESIEAILARLDRAEEQTLARYQAPQPASPRRLRRRNSGTALH
ncbi:MAG: DUF6525 family protein [Pararhodobacter sp.]